MTTINHIPSSLLFILICFFLLFLAPPPSSAALVRQQPLVLQYHKGPLLTGSVVVDLVWYGTFTPLQRSIIVDFLNSLSADETPSPSVASWWNTTARYHRWPTTIFVGAQFLHAKYTLGKNLKQRHLLALASKPRRASIKFVTLVLTASDVAIDGFCVSSCGGHAATQGKARSVWAWVGNARQQCPGFCAWPFFKPQYGPQTPPLVAPNADVGVDGMVINIATVLAGAVTNPFRTGYFQGEAGAPMYEAVSACAGTFGKDAYPGYPGEVAVDKTTGASYNAHGVRGRKFLLPAMWDPKTDACSVPT